MKCNSYDGVCYVHNKYDLCVALWADNNIVTTLSNYHPPEFLEADSGMLRKKKRADNTREKERTMVKCPVQNKDYSNTFHLIDKINLMAKKSI